MKRIICFGLMLVLCMGVFTGCAGKMDVDTSTVFVDRKGHVVSVDVEKLDKDYYDVSELEDYITEHVTDYTAENGETVKKEAFEAEEGIAKLQMKYDSYEDYAKFNGIEMYVGTVVQAQADGYDFDVAFNSVSDGKMQESATQEDVLSHDDYKLVVIKANVNVQVNGTIFYVSKQNTEVTGKNTVSITGEEASEEAALTYIIYK